TLVKEIWKVHVSRGVVKVCFHRIRQALGDSVKKPQFIESVPWRGYRFLVNARREAEIPMPSPGTTAVVGRKEEIEQLHTWLDAASRGRRQIVFVTGEPGIGKTTVVRTFLEQVAATGKAAIGRGQCIEHYGAGEAYRPVLEALGRIGRAPGGDTLIAWMKEYAPAWLVQMPTFLGAAESETLQRKLQGATRESMLREFSEGIEVMTEQRPFILVLEDLQWSDYSTLDLLAALAH